MPDVVERNNPETDSIRILRISDVVQKTGLSRTSIYQRLRHQDFPRPVELGPRAIGFIESEVDDFLRRLVKKRDTDLVAR